MALYKFYYYYLCKPITCILFTQLLLTLAGIWFAAIVHHHASSPFTQGWHDSRVYVDFFSSISVRSPCDLGAWKLISKNGVPRLPVGEKCIIPSSLVLMHYQHVTDTDMLPILKLHSSIPKGKGVPYPKEYRQVPNHQPWLNATKTPVSNLHTVKPFGLQLHDWSYNNSDHNYFLHLCDTGGST